MLRTGSTAISGGSRQGCRRSHERLRNISYIKIKGTIGLLIGLLTDNRIIPNPRIAPLPMTPQPYLFPYLSLWNCKRVATKINIF